MGETAATGAVGASPRRCREIIFTPFSRRVPPLRRRGLAGETGEVLAVAREAVVAVLGEAVMGEVGQTVVLEEGSGWRALGQA